MDVQERRFPLLEEKKITVYINQLIKYNFSPKKHKLFSMFKPYTITRGTAPEKLPGPPPETSYTSCCLVTKCHFVVSQSLKTVHTRVSRPNEFLVTSGIDCHRHLWEEDEPVEKARVQFSDWWPVPPRHDEPGRTRKQINQAASRKEHVIQVRRAREHCE